MQTVLVIQSSAAGAVYLSGRMAGEVDEDHPLSMPVSPFGALLIELRPFARGLLPLSVRLPLSHGVPILPGPDPRLCAALWPGGTIELELLPESVPDPTPRFLAQEGDTRLFYFDKPALRCESPASVSVHPLPEGALKPSVTLIDQGILLIGERMTGDQYAVVLSPDGSQALLSVTGRSVSPLNGSTIRLLRPCGDSVGHAALETWAYAPSGWQLTASEPMWEQGAPHWPMTPEATALAAAEAAQMGLTAEAAACFAPTCRHEELLAPIREYDGCTPLRHPLPGGETAVGLMKLKDNVLHIVPLVYSAIPGGPRGGYQLTQFEIRK